MKRTTVFLLVFLPVFSFAATVNPINISQINIKLENDIKKTCAKYSNPAANVSCFSKLLERDAEDYRGTEEYAEKHYKALSSDALYSKLLALEKLKQSARYRDDAYFDPVEGELTKEDYQLEIDWIAKELNDRHYRTPSQRKYDDWYHEHVRVLK